ncbi:MAG: superoxide dismutase [Gammaproteobacteria bacterium]|nr:superoxide dismutase [Gammaproteobacteria bacterium]
MPFELIDLPYAKDALAPHISEETVTLHYEKHHGGYVKKLNREVKDSVDAEKSLRELILTSGGKRFNLAAQIWNHDFYWRSLDPQGGGDPRGEVGRAIAGAFGSADNFKQAFADAAISEFGSGWAWLVVNPAGTLEVTSTSDADNPLTRGAVPLLTVDVWEHAYYVDYRNERARYVEACIEHLLNWEQAERRFTQWREKNAA